MNENNIIKCVFMDGLYGVRTGDLITTEDAYWMNDELIINSLLVGENFDAQYSAMRIIEMKIGMTPNVRISTPIVGKLVGRTVIDKFRNVTLFTLEV